MKRLSFSWVAMRGPPTRCPFVTTNTSPWPFHLRVQNELFGRNQVEYVFSVARTAAVARNGFKTVCSRLEAVSSKWLEAVGRCLQPVGIAAEAQNGWETVRNGLKPVSRRRVQNGDSNRFGCNTADRAMRSVENRFVCHVGMRGNAFPVCAFAPKNQFPSGSTSCAGSLPSDSAPRTRTPEKAEMATILKRWQA